MVERADAPSAPSPTPMHKSAGPRYLVLLALIIIGTAIGALWVALAFGALLTFLPAIAGVLCGLALGLAAPLFLALRADAALKRRRSALLLRRFTVMFLIGATQLALFGAVLTWSSRATGDLAWTAHKVLDLAGGVPIVSELLYTHAERTGCIPGAELDKQKTTAAAAANDAGVVDVKVTSDGGVLDHDGGSTAPAITSSPHTRTPQPPRAKPGVPLSPRVEGKAARTFAAAVTMSDGAAVIAVGTVSVGGAVTFRIVSLAAHEKLGATTLVESADDGTVAAILGGSHLLVSRPGKTTAEVVKALSPGQKLAAAKAGADEIQSVRDVVIGPGGAGLAIVTVLAAAPAGNGEVHERLITLPKGQAPASVLRRAGDPVPGAQSEATIAKSWSFKKGAGTAAVLVVESYLEGGDDLGTHLNGENYTVNPQRLLVVKLDAPKALVEIARTGLEPSGIADRELQIFGDATLLPDGRVVFDANFLEKGDDGWLFVSKPAGGVFALAPDKRDADTALWTRTAPRARSLEAAADGSLLFRRNDGAAILTSADRPNEAVAALLGADALTSDGKPRGSITSVDVPTLAQGGWLFASVQLRAADGTTHDAVVLASSTDIANGKAEVIFEVGAALPGFTTTSPATIQSIRYGRGRDELLWP